jgi:hypothetical protein
MGGLRSGGVSAGPVRDSNSFPHCQQRLTDPISVSPQCAHLTTIQTKLPEWGVRFNLDCNEGRPPHLAALRPKL